MQKIITKEDIYSNFSRLKTSLAHTKKHFVGFYMYAPKGAECIVVSRSGDVLIAEYDGKRFPVHISKISFRS